MPKTVKRDDDAESEEYTKKTPHEHVLTLPDTYIGSIEPEQTEMWILDDDEKTFTKKEIKNVPGLYKIFDEILVNAHDQSVREKSCKTIKVTIDKEKGEISVWNDGRGIPVTINTKEKIYNPELIFGNLFTSSNYDKKGKRWGGKNGFGAKLTNIYSKHFYVETVDTVNGKKYYQHFYDNMYKKDDPVITKVGSDTSPYVKITFIPDYKRFGMESLTDDMCNLFKKRVYDIAGCDCARVKVYINKKLINIKSLGDYISMYYPSTEDHEQKFTYANIGEYWKVGVVYTPDAGTQISHVNGIWTYNGGTHVTHVSEKILNGLVKFIEEKYKDIKVRKAYLRDNLTFFVDCITEDPSFNSQSKDTLTTKSDKFLEPCDINQNFINAVAKLGVVEEAVAFAKLKDSAELKKTDGHKVRRLFDVPKLEDAHWAGTGKSRECRLIITEGDSAKSFAMNGLELIGKDKYGVFPIRGKMLNVRDASPKKIAENQEIKYIKEIIGLQQNVVYTKDNMGKLRYGGILVLTDADLDGSHIKGLIFNFIHYFWPELLKMNGFFQTLATPIVVVTKKGKKSKKSKNIDNTDNNKKIFYTMHEFEDWTKTAGSDINNWITKYYKGLGTSTRRESCEAFENFEKKLITYVDDDKQEEVCNEKESSNKEKSTNDDEDEDETDESDNDTKNKDTEKSDESDDVVVGKQSKTTAAINKAFSKSMANDRKKWLKKYNKNIEPDIKEQQLTYSDFVDKDFIHFSNYDNMRSIPSVRDGFKPSQRKILFAIMEKDIDRASKEQKVNELSSIVSTRTAYLHGDTSLVDTITGMAQTFVGSNNINLLYPSGEFGTRRQGGKDAASGRYIHSFLSSITKYIFRKEDEPVYNNLVEENKVVEPETYAPIIPMILVNGTQGIGTGYSTYVPNHNPKDIVNNLIRLLEDKDPQPMKPWYRGFVGDISNKGDNSWVSYGKYEPIDDYNIKITELPVGYWTDDYIEFIKSNIIDRRVEKHSEGKQTKRSSRTAKVSKNPFITDFINDSSNVRVDLTLKFNGNDLQKLIKSDEINKKLKLTKNINESNMYLYNPHGIMTKYDTTEEILLDFYSYRLDLYSKRKEYYTKVLENELAILKYKVKFIKQYIDREIIIERKTKHDIIEKLKELKYPKLSADINAVDIEESDNVNDDEHQDDSHTKKISIKTYRYITDMALFSLTKEKIDELDEKYKNKKDELDMYENMTEKELWKKELNEFMNAYDEWLEEMKLEEAEANHTKKSTRKIKCSKKKSTELSLN